MMLIFSRYLDADLTYLNFLVGVTIMFCLVPIQTYFYKRDRLKRGGQGRPEARFLTSLVTVWGFPISLFWFAFTSDGSVSYWSPIMAGLLLGIVDPLLYISMLNYITGKAYLAPVSSIFISANPYTFVQIHIPMLRHLLSLLSLSHLSYWPHLSRILVSSIPVLCINLDDTVC
jgi:hypothetical protein